MAIEPATLTQFSKIVTNETIPYMPYQVIEPNLDVSTVIVTFLMWSAMYFVTVPAAIIDYFWTGYTTQSCKN